jgi:hypothetical protein
MPFYIVHVSGSSAAKRTAVDPGNFDTYETAEDAAQARWAGRDYFVVEAEDARSAARRAIGDSRPLDNWAP